MISGLSKGNRYFANEIKEMNNKAANKSCLCTRRAGTSLLRQNSFQMGKTANEIDTTNSKDAIRVAMNQIYSPPARLAGFGQQRGGASLEATVRDAQFGPRFKLSKRWGNQHSGGELIRPESEGVC